MLPEPDWLESVGSYVASTPPSRWKDDDEITFNEKLDAVVQKFLRVESLVFGSAAHRPTGSLFRVALTAKDGQERDQVVRLNLGEERIGRSLEKKLTALLPDNRRLSVHALSRLMWKLLEQK